MAKGFFHGDEVGRAEGHRLIAEAINDVLKTPEAIRREAVEVEVEVSPVLHQKILNREVSSTQAL